MASPSQLAKLSVRNKLAFFTSLVSFVFLVPGVYLSMLSVSATGSIHAKLPQAAHSIFTKAAAPEYHQMGLKIFDTTRSILKTVENLWDRDYYFVAIMIFLFSIIVPVTKGSLVSYLFFSKRPEHRQKIFAFVRTIGKWSMCDVFITAIFLSYMATGATETESSKNIAMMGHPIHVDILAGMHAQLHVGFWCFLTYCILSLLALQLYESY